MPRAAFSPVTGRRGPSRVSRARARTTEAVYKAGDKVRHPTFGVGIVVGVRLDAETEIVDVNFAGGAVLRNLTLLLHLCQCVTWTFHCVA